jgi:hypothetical protein
MAAKVKIIRSVDYMEISDSGTINFPESRKKLRKIVREDPPADCNVLLDFRRTQWIISTDEIFNLVELILDEEDVIEEKLALLLLPGVNFDRERFRELCSDFKKIPVRTFTNYEDAIQWFYDR